MDQQRFDAIRLARSPRIGPVSFRQLIARFGNASEALRALPGLLARRGGGRAFVPASEAAVAREVERVESLGAHWLIRGDSSYPLLLAETDDAPPVLIYRGDVALAGNRCVAMVGARNASAAACRYARELARDLCGAGLVVVSGLARGIDTAAHRGCLGDDGTTIGVIASGIDIAYPPENAELQERIARDALLLAEQPPGAEPKAKHFPNRNRIIAGMCQATLVVEAAPRSGSLITARLAGEYGREVLAVPGSPFDPRAQGCNHLIREGATLIQTADDVLEAIDRIDPRLIRETPCDDPFSANDLELDEKGQASLDSLLSPSPVAIDELVRQSALPTAAVQMALVEMELAGRVERHAGGKVALSSGGA